MDCLLDSGAEICAISHHVLKQVAPSEPLKPSDLTAIVGVCGERHSVLGMVDLSFECQGLTFTQSFHVFQHLHAKMIVGIDFLQRNNVTVRFGEVEIPLDGRISSGSTVRIATTTVTSAQTGIVYPQAEVIVPPHSEVIIPTKVSGFPNQSTILLEPILRLSDNSLAGSKCITVVQNGKCVYRLMNPTNLPVFLKTNRRIAKASLVDTEAIHDFNTENEANVFNLSSEKNKQSSNYEEILKELGINLNCEHLTEDQKQLEMRVCKTLCPQLYTCP